MDDQQRFTFKKEERITGDQRVENLFTGGRSLMAYPFRVVYKENEQSLPVGISVLITIPKKRIRSAVQRNRLKRLTREAFRLNKHLFDRSLLQEDILLDVAFIYVKDDVADFEMVEKGIRKALLALRQQFESGKENE